MSENCGKKMKIASSWQMREENNVLLTVDNSTEPEAKRPVPVLLFLALDWSGPHFAAIVRCLRLHGRFGEIYKGW